MGRIEAVNQPVQEAPAIACPIEEQPIHLGRQPHQRQPLGERRLAFLEGAVDLHDPAFRSALGRRRVATGADLGLGSGAIDQPRGHRPGSRRHGRGFHRTPLDLGQFRPAQAPARRQERDRLEEIGLARPVGPGQHHGPRIDLEHGLAIAAELGQRDTRQMRRRWSGRERPCNDGRIGFGQRSQGSLPRGTFAQTRIGIST
jgi:hypothetical protein